MTVDLCLLFENEAPGKTTFVYENFVSLAISFNFTSFNFFLLRIKLFFLSLILLSEKIHDFCVTFHDFTLNSLEYFSSPYVENFSKNCQYFHFSLHNFIFLYFYLKFSLENPFFHTQKNLFIFPFIRSKKGQKPPLNVSRTTKRKKYIKIYFFFSNP
jgi:hypothetical protein